MENPLMQNAVKDIRDANKIIIKRHRYFCGLVSDEVKGEIGCADLFFQSPDGQCGELYTELLKLGYKHKMYQAEYYWKVYKLAGATISYSEGDISIY